MMTLKFCFATWLLGTRCMIFSINEAPIYVPILKASCAQLTDTPFRCIEQRRNSKVPKEVLLKKP